MKFCFIDTETTGVTPKVTGLVQLAGRIVIDGKMVEEFNIKAAPFAGDVIEPESLKVTGLTPEIIYGYQPANQAYRQFTALLGKYCDKYKRSDKFFFVAYYADFDSQQIRSWFEKNNDSYFGSWFWMPVLDIAKLAGLRLMERRHQMQDFKLMTVARFLGIEVDPEKAHDAMYDIDIAMQIYMELADKLAATAKAGI